MSLFYNVKILGTKTIEAENSKISKNNTPCEFKETRTSTILDKQNDYQVGVCRFKIPSKNIPMFKLGDIDEGLYPNIPYYAMYMFYVGENIATFINDAPLNGHIYKSQPAYLNGDGLAFRMADINTQTKSTTQDTVAPPKSIYNNGLNINTEDEWIDHLNALSMNAMSGLRYTYQMNNAIVSENVYPNQLIVHYGKGATWRTEPKTYSVASRPMYNSHPQNYTVSLPALAQNETYNFEFSYPTPTQAVPIIVSRLVYNFVVRLGQIDMSNGGYCKDLSLRLFSPADATGARHSWFLLDGFGGSNQSKFNNNLWISPMFPTNIKTLVGNEREDGKQQFPAEQKNGVAQNILVKPLAENFLEFFKGIKANGQGGWLLEIKNNGRGVLSAGAKMEFCLFDEIQQTLTDVCRVSPFAGIEIPTYSFDSDNGLINYNINSNYFIPQTSAGVAPAPNILVQPLRMGFENFMNFNLQGLFNFSFQKVPSSYSTSSSWDLSNQGSSFYRKNIDPSDNQGSIIIIPTQDIDMDNGGKDLIINEFQSSRYLRQNLHSLIFSSAVMSVKGELLNDGNKSRKVITDFEINPDEIQTYIQYFSQGYMRYYPLESNLPLRDMGIKVFYETDLGEVFPLTIPNGSIATIKLEFRPNNMIMTS
jgi:hypothetical protein